MKNQSVETHIFIQDLVSQGAIFYCSHSGGKDSQAMYNMLSNVVPYRQLVVVHADLGEVEWHGTIEHIENTTRHDVNIVKANKTFSDMVRKRGMFPSPRYRQCTSDLKTGPIYKFIRRDMKERGAMIGINCVGIRAEESAARSKKKRFTFNKTLTNKSRIVMDYLPILEWPEHQVFAFIDACHQQPHYAYKKNKRLSCVFCIMGCKSDLQHGAEQRPELLAEYIALEQETGHSMFYNNGRAVSLIDMVDIQAAIPAEGLGAGVTKPCV